MLFHTREPYWHTHYTQPLTSEEGKLRHGVRGGVRFRQVTKPKEEKSWKQLCHGTAVSGLPEHDRAQSMGREDVRMMGIGNPKVVGSAWARTIPRTCRRQVV